MCVIFCKINDRSIVYHIPGWDVYLTKNDTLKRPHIPIPPPHKNLSNTKHKYVSFCVRLKTHLQNIIYLDGTLILQKMTHSTLQKRPQNPTPPSPQIVSSTRHKYVSFFVRLTTHLQYIIYLDGTFILQKMTHSNVLTFLPPIKIF